MVHRQSGEWYSQNILRKTFTNEYPGNSLDRQTMSNNDGHCPMDNIQRRKWVWRSVCRVKLFLGLAKFLLLFCCSTACHFLVVSLSIHTASRWREALLNSVYFVAYFLPIFLNYFQPFSIELCGSQEQKLSTICKRKVPVSKFKMQRFFTKELLYTSRPERGETLEFQTSKIFWNKKKQLTLFDVPIFMKMREDSRNSLRKKGKFTVKLPLQRSQVDLWWSPK